jgi:hypothetical protein
MNKTAMNAGIAPKGSGLHVKNNYQEKENEKLEITFYNISYSVQY